MKLLLIAVGQKMPAWVTTAYEEYARRFPRDLPLELIEIPAGKRGKNADIKRILDTEGEKMSKSLGNVTNLVDLVQHYDPRAYRMLLLQTHYRSPVKVGQDNIDAAVNSLAGLDGFANRMATASLPATASDETVLAQFRSHMDNELM